MKHWILTIMLGGGLALIGLAQNAVLTRVKVVKNNCNLRAKALVTSEVVAQVSENTILLAKTISSEWVEVVPPTNVDLWVLGDYVKDGAINCRNKVNVRAGAGINFNIVGQLSPGEKIEIRGTHAEWVKIAPPEACSLWIARELVKEIPKMYVEPAKLEKARTESANPILPVAAVKTPPLAPPSQPVAVAKPPEPLPKKSAPVLPVIESTPSPAPPPAAPSVFFTPLGLDLVPGRGQGSWREVEGILRTKDYIFRAPSDFRLVARVGDKKNSTTICFVKGNQVQLEALVYRRLIISGREYWVKRQKYPVIIPERIVLK